MTFTDEDNAICAGCCALVDPHGVDDQGYCNDCSDLHAFDDDADETAA